VTAAEEQYLWQHIDKQDTFSTVARFDPELLPDA